MPRCDLAVTYRGAMGGQVLGGGVIVFVAVALWLVYLLPSWQSRHRFTSAERNAVRLNQALRVLAETAETPREVHLELTARTAHQQQKIARQVQAQKAQTELAEAKARLEVARLEAARDRDLVKEQRAAAVELARAERAAAVEIAKAERAAALEKARAEQAAAVERAHAERAAAVSRPELRRARARRRFRLATTSFAALALVAVVAGGIQAFFGAAPVLLSAGGVVLVLALIVLQRLSRVAARATARPVVVTAERAPIEVQDFGAAAPAPRPTWTPRELPSRSPARRCAPPHGSRSPARSPPRRRPRRSRSRGPPPRHPAPLPRPTRPWGTSTTPRSRGTSAGSSSAARRASDAPPLRHARGSPESGGARAS